MRYQQGDLPILSAEVYDDSTSRTATSRRRTQAPAPSTRATTEDGSRKRARTETTQIAEPAEDEKKRARGRPRLDTKDETAADRRRTQIRLAQRAYRNRKENAIHTLEKKVQQLKDTNEEMSNAFMQLHDFALTNGLLDQIPDFGRQLRETTERFLSLAREASDDDEKDGEPKASTTSSQTGSRRSNRRSSSDSPAQADSSQTSAATSSLEPGAGNTPKTLLGGLTVSYEPVTQQPFPTSTPLANPHPPPPLFPPTTAYEIITHPTLENASFPFQTAPGLHLLSEQQEQQQQQQQQPQQPPNNGPNQPATSPSPWLTLPAPDTYTPFESTFGRRLQRYAIERAFVLINMPAPPKKALKRVFGFALLLESPLTISRRLARQLGRDEQTSLHNWGYPFLQLGGAGTHFDGSVHNFQGSNMGGQGGNGGGRRMGNQGTVDVGKPATTAGFATGPFEEVVNSVRDSVLDRDMRMELPGLRGEYFDCDEVEMYLYQRGVVIPPGSDVITVEVDAAVVGGSGGYGAGEGWMSGMGNVADGVSSGASSGPSPGVSDGSDAASQVQEALSGGWSAGGGAGLVDPAIGDMYSQGSSFMPATTLDESASVPSYASASDMGNMLPFGALVPDGASSSGFGMGVRRPSPRRRVVVDVMRLVKELSSRATCLGRSPGVKREDVDEALSSALQAGLL